MLVLIDKEVDIKRIEERFLEKGKKYHRIDLGYPDIGVSWEFEELRKIHPQDWRQLSAKIMEEYKNEDVDLIIASARMSDTSFRSAECYTTSYKMI